MVLEQEKISRGDLLSWRQCPRRLWLQQNTEPTAVALANYTPSDKNAARDALYSLYPHAQRVLGDAWDQRLQATQQLLQQRPDLTLLGAVFEYRGMLIRPDVLLPSNRGFRMIHLKVATAIKPGFEWESEIAAWALTQLGYKLRTVEMAYINSAFIYEGNQNYHGLFLYQTLSHKLPEVATWLAAAQSTLQADEPMIKPAAHCQIPAVCPFRRHCSPPPPSAKYPLDVLYRMSATDKNKLRAQGYVDARDVPAELLTPTQQWIQQISRCEQAELLPGAQALMAQYGWPRYYFDFEAVNFAVPPWPKMSPYKTLIPFQWSCHIEQQHGQLSQHMFLQTSGDDPRRACAESMLAILGETGPIFVYAEQFEKERIRELATLFPDLATGLLALNQRVVDLLPIARRFYYHPAMMGSWSIKSVLPTIAPELVYSELAVSNGGEAMQIYHRLQQHDLTTQQRQYWQQALADYCALDTLALVKLLHFLCGQSSA